MLKIQLACKEVVKAVKVAKPESVPWVRKLLAGEGGEEWGVVETTLRAGVGDSSDWARCAAITLDSAVLDAAALTVSLLRNGGDEAAAAGIDRHAEVLTHLSQLFGTLRTFFPSHAWRPSSLLACLHAACSLEAAAVEAPPSTADKALRDATSSFYTNVVEFFVQACRALRSGEHNTMYTLFFTDSYCVGLAGAPGTPKSTPSPAPKKGKGKGQPAAGPASTYALFRMLLSLRAYQPLASIVFHTVQEWTEYFPSKITQEEVTKAFAAEGAKKAAEAAVPKEAKESKAAGGGKKSTLRALFVALEALYAANAVGFNLATVLRAFEHAVTRGDSTGSVAAAARAAASTIPADVMTEGCLRSGGVAAVAAAATAAEEKSVSVTTESDALYQGTSVTTLRLVHVLLQIGAPKGCRSLEHAAAAAFLPHLSGLVEVLCGSGLYQSQVDIIYNAGYGFALLSWANGLVSAATAASGEVPAHVHSAAVHAALCMLSMYHKITEPSLGAFVRTALVNIDHAAAGVKGMKSARTAEAFMEEAFRLYAQMQALDPVMEAVCAASASEEGVEAQPASFPSFLPEMIAEYVEKVIDPSSVLTKLTEGYNNQLGDRRDNPVLLAASCGVLSAVLNGLSVTDSTYIQAAKWVDAVVTYLSSLLVLLLKKKLAAQDAGSDSDSEAAMQDDEDEDAAEAQARQALLCAVLSCYFDAQALLDRVAPFFLVNDIFAWSTKMVSAFQLAAAAQEEGDISEPQPAPLLIFPGMAYLSRSCTQALLLSLWDGVDLDAVKGDAGLHRVQCLDALLRILVQRASRLLRHAAVLDVRLAGAGPDAAALTELLAALNDALATVCGQALATAQELAATLRADIETRGVARRNAKRVLLRAAHNPRAPPTGLEMLCAVFPAFAERCSATRTEALLRELVVIRCFLHTQQEGSIAAIQAAAAKSAPRHAFSSLSDDALWVARDPDREAEAASGLVAFAAARVQDPLRVLLASPDTWESEATTDALLKGALRALKGSREEEGAPGAEVLAQTLPMHIGAVLKAFPKECLRGDMSVLDTLCSIDAAADCMLLKAQLREAIAAVASQNPKWCANFLPDLSRRIVELEEGQKGQKDKHYGLNNSTLRLACAVLPAVTDEERLVRFCYGLAGKALRRGRHDLSLNAIAVGLLSYREPGTGAAAFAVPPMAGDVQDVKKRLRKMAKKSAAATAAAASAEAEGAAPPPAKRAKADKSAAKGRAASTVDRVMLLRLLVRGMEHCDSPVLDAAVLLVMQHEGLSLEEEQKHRDNVMQKLSRRLNAEDKGRRRFFTQRNVRSTELLMAALLESSLADESSAVALPAPAPKDGEKKPAKPAQKKSERTPRERLFRFLFKAVLAKAADADNIAAAAGTGVSGGAFSAAADAAVRRVNTEGMEGVLLQRLATLPARQRHDLLDLMLKGATADPRGGGALKLFHVFVLTCPKEYATVHEHMLLAAVARVVAEAHLAALQTTLPAHVSRGGRGSSGEVVGLPALLGVTSAVFLMEKLPLPPSCLSIALSIPGVALGRAGARAGASYAELHVMCVNLLVNVLMHRTEAIEWGAFTGAVGDVLDGLLTHLDADRGGSDAAEDLVSGTVRLVELYAGTRRRAGLPETVKSAVSDFAPLLLQRFLLGVTGHAVPASVHNRDLSRAFGALSSACGKDLFQSTYANLPQALRAAAAAYHLQWQSTRFQGKT